MIVIGVTEILSARWSDWVQGGVIRVVEILVGSTVAVLIYAIGPEEKMANAAEWVFAQELEDCRSAVDDVAGNQDAEGRCLTLMERFPNRPEPFELLGRYTYRNASLKSDGLKKSRGFFVQALKLYDVTPEEHGSDLKERFTDRQLNTLREIIKGIAVTSAEVVLREFAEGARSGENASNAMGVTLTLSRHAARL